VRAVADGCSLKTTLKSVPKDTNSGLVEQAFREIAGKQLPDDSSPPKNAAKSIRQFVAELLAAI
jgi:hypothetical protein